jgi:Uri superfamily endonuclease
VDGAEKRGAPVRPQTYQLYITVDRRVGITVGRLGPVTFPPGRYVYTGSAKRNMVDRVARHFRREKRVRWHIDYLLAAPGVRITNVRYFTQSECRANRQIAGKVTVPGFGASDCGNGCGGHLKYLGALRGD